MSHIFKFFFSNFQSIGGTLILISFIYVLWNDAVRQSIVNKVCLIANDLLPTILIIFIMVALVRGIFKTK